jgi:hypothetical protein
MFPEADTPRQRGFKEIKNIRFYEKRLHAIVRYRLPLRRPHCYWLGVIVGAQLRSTPS